MRKLSKDSIFNGRIKLLQPKNGYRIAIDPIILASFIRLKPNQKILDVGCGVGTISFILKMREKASQITAIDLHKEMCEICEKNSQINSLSIETIHCRVEDMQSNSILKDRLFDQIITNPPFFKKSASRLSSSKNFSNFETTDLSNWISHCIRRLKNNGIFSIIHCPARLDDIVYILHSAGSIKVIPIFSKIKDTAKRVVVKFKKGSKSATEILPGLVIHEKDGNYSDKFQKILAGNFDDFYG
ncbi:MAG: methyltransferase [Holosporaceae bacterium]|jgi:tRNA1(Val) A37 N6-methylase TrmN6|nr:methyltransferase [Holosporaceae bacterium]